MSYFEAKYAFGFGFVSVTLPYGRKALYLP